jgi:ZF-HD class homeobox domain-containing protein
MEFRNQDEEISHISSSLNYTHNSNANLTPYPNHSSIRISSTISSPRPTTGAAATYASSGNGHQIDSPRQAATKFHPNPNTSNVASNSTATYHECLKNHAAALGGHVLDGCGEFMPDPDNPLRCEACTCHRSFHRKDFVCTNRVSGTSHVSVPLLLPPAHHPYPYQGRQYQSGLSGGTTTESSSEEKFGTRSAVPTHTSSKKRHRTKFTGEQKEKMLCFAERIGWRIQKQDEKLVEQFCNEVGVRRRVLKVWMHNNKHSGRKLDQLQQSQVQQEVHLQQSPNQQVQ